MSGDVHAPTSAGPDPATVPPGEEPAGAAAPPVRAPDESDRPEIFVGAAFAGGLIAATILFILGGIAGMIASRLFKAGAPPMPEMAIDEARKTKEELS